MTNKKNDQETMFDSLKRNTLIWDDKMPLFNKDCLLLTATEYGGEWDYTLFQIKRVDFEGGRYWGIFDHSGDEWGDIDELTAEKYAVIEPLEDV